MLFELKMLMREFLANQDDKKWIEDNEDRYFRVIEIVIMEFQHNPKFTVPVLKHIYAEYPLRKFWVLLLRRWPIFGVQSIYIHQIKEMVCPKIGKYPLEIISHDDEKSVVDKVLIVAVLKRFKKNVSAMESMQSCLRKMN